MDKKKSVVQLDRSLGFFSSLSLVVGTVIGSGIFFKQASVLDYSGSTNNALLAWTLGGLITLTSGLTIAEIGAQLPHTGGLYIYMEKIYGKLWGFLTGWMQIVIYGPAMIAALGAYLAVLLVSFFNLPQSSTLVIAVSSVVILTAFNLLANRFGAYFQNITTIAKFIPIVAIIIFGLFFGNQNAFGQSLQTVAHNSNSNLGVAILATLFAYDGWILLANMGGEIKNVKKTLPLAIICGILLVLLTYMSVTFAIFRVMPADLIHKLGENATPHFATIAFGNLGGRLLNIGIIISIIGCMNGKIMSFPRIMYAMAKNDELPFSKQISYIHKTMKTPMVATTITSLIAIGMILCVDADRLTEVCIFTIYCFYVMTFFGIFKLRKQNSNGDHFKTPLYPIVPIIAIVCTTFVLISEIFSDLPGVIVSLIFILVGIPVYWYKQKNN